ncbi:hypothetical protein FRB90_003775 [Tulasnella sp. 427]|nr:hypothetical protein FRB90_003775 [Tulasnella sp. 427]
MIVKVFVAGVSDLDRLVVRNRVKGSKGDEAYGFVPGRAFVGKVIETGWEVNDVRSGDWVMGLTELSTSSSGKGGTLAEYVVVDRTRVSRAPKPGTILWPGARQGLTMEQIVGLPLVAVFAHRAVKTFPHAVVTMRRTVPSLTSPPASPRKTRVKGKGKEKEPERPAKLKVLVLGANTDVGDLVVQEFMLRDDLDVHVQVPDGADVLLWEGLENVHVVQGDNVENVLAGLQGEGYVMVVDCVGGEAVWKAARRVLDPRCGQFTTLVGDDPSLIPTRQAYTKSGLRSLKHAFIKSGGKTLGYEWVCPAVDVDTEGDDVRTNLVEIARMVEQGMIVPPTPKRVVMFERGMEAFKDGVDGLDPEYLTQQAPPTTAESAYFTYIYPPTPALTYAQSLRTASTPSTAPLASIATPSPARNPRPFAFVPPQDHASPPATSDSAVPSTASSAPNFAFRPPSQPDPTHLSYPTSRPQTRVRSSDSARPDGGLQTHWEQPSPPLSGHSNLEPLPEEEKAIGDSPTCQESLWSTAEKLDSFHGPSPTLPSCNPPSLSTTGVKPPEYEARTSITVPPDHSHYLNDIDDDEDSPYPEVRASVSNTDDPDMPCLTFRVWTLGILLNLMMSGANMYLYLRYPAPDFRGPFVLVISYIVGSLFAAVLPIRLWNIAGYEFSLNPGPFNVKEHALICILDVITFGEPIPYGIGPVIAWEKNYGRPLRKGFTFLFLLSSRLLGIGLAGLCRRIFVYPASAIWPKNIVVNQLFGSVTGLGLNIITFDWAQIAYNFSPLTMPFWAQLQTFIAFAIVYWIIVPVLYYSDVWKSGHLPLIGISAYDRFAQPYNLTRVFDPDTGRFNLAAYEAYSPIYLPISFVMTYTIAFAIPPALIVDYILKFGPSVYQIIRNRKKADYDRDDIHAKLMRRYPEVPQWCYVTLLVVFLAISVGVAFVSKLNERDLQN